MNLSNTLYYAGTALDLTNQALELKNTLSNQDDASSSGDNYVENHYHIHKTSEEIALEKRRLEMLEEQAQFNRATTRSQHAENIRTQRAILDNLNRPPTDNTFLYMLGGLLLIGILFTTIKNNQKSKD